MNMKIDIPKDVEYIIKHLSFNGYDAFIVGGCVRDCIMGKIPNDWDICTNAHPGVICDLFSQYKLIKNGIKHGTIGVIINTAVYEITTFRIDGNYNDFRHPDDVLFVCDIKSDLKRRDFTVNAIAYNEFSGFVDPFIGFKDIQNKIIRTVGNPDERFFEDSLRIMRALRFSATLGFEIEENTKKSIIKNAHLLESIAVERIQQEFIKILLCDNPFVLFEYSKVFATFTRKNSLDIKLYQMFLNLPKELHLRFCAYAISLYEKDIDFKEKVLKLTKKLKLDKRTSQKIKAITENLNIDIKEDIKELRLLISRLGYDLVFDILLLNLSIATTNSTEYKTTKKALSLFEEIKQKGLCCLVSELNINGDDLIKNTIPPGKKTGVILNKLLKLVIIGDIPNNKSALIKKALKIYNEEE